MSLNQHFDKVVVLTQKKRIDRQYLFTQMAEEIGLSFKWFYAIEDENPKKSFNLSHKAILTQFSESNLNTLLVLEDDCDFRNLDKLESIMRAAPEQWDLLYFGANLKPTPEFTPPEKENEHWYSISNAYCTHAIAYDKGVAGYIVRNYDGETMYDAWLDTKLHLMEAFCCSPFLAYQRPTRSDLWDRNVDYTDTFQASENYLKSLP
jgi:DNA-binding XRE family transcriptional regulator